MRTANLIDSLATDLTPVGASGPAPALAKAALTGAALSLVAVVSTYGVQPGLMEPARLTPFAIKAGYAAMLGLGALVAAVRLSRPDGVSISSRLIAPPFALLGLLAAWQLAATPAADMPHALLGGSWNRCPFRIAALSLPVLGALIVALRRRAPTDLRRAGAAAGLLAGSLAAIVYALACTENSPAFVLVWYSLGIAAATGVGALAGPRLLRW